MDYQFFNCELTCNLLNKCLLSFYQTIISVSDLRHTCVTCIFNKYFEEEKGKKVIQHKSRLESWNDTYQFFWCLSQNTVLVYKQHPHIALKENNI